jgi:hypothetical protein
LSSLTAIFGNSDEKSEDSEKLMELYWNRAELKKEFADMRKEQYRLKDLIKEHKGRTARVQQQLDHLESLLIDPDWVHNIAVFYQLRGLGKHCERKLARFAEQLKQQREQKTHDSVLDSWNEQRKEESRALEAQALDKRDQVQQLEDQLQFEQRRLTSMGAISRLFKGRSVMKLVDSLASRLETAVQEEQGLHDAIEEVMNREPPDHQGLDIAAKRSINLMILAFAQEIYSHFDEDGLARLVKESTEKSAGAINYGSRYECSQLLDRVQKSAERLKKSGDYADTLKRRAVLLGEKARFASNEDAVPAPGSMGSLFKIDERGLIREIELDITAQNYWNITRVFSR